MTFTAKELNAAIRANDGTVVAVGDDADGWQPDSVQEAFQEECDFTVPGIEGKFTYSTQERDTIEPDTYTFVVQHTDGRYFGLFGIYDSWNGVEVDDDSVHEIEHKEFTVKSWTTVRS